MERFVRRPGDETPFVTRALYGSATVLALLVAARATTEAVAHLAHHGAALWTALIPDAAIAGVVALLVGLGWLIRRAVFRSRAPAPA